MSLASIITEGATLTAKSGRQTPEHPDPATLSDAQLSAEWDALKSERAGYEALPADHRNAAGKRNRDALLASTTRVMRSYLAEARKRQDKADKDKAAK